MKAGGLLAAAIVAEVLATSALKASNGLHDWRYAVTALVGYGVAFSLLALTLRTIPVGIAYALWSGVGIALITAVGWWRFGERPDAAALLGFALIVAGVLVLQLGSRMAVR